MSASRGTFLVLLLLALCSGCRHQSEQERDVRIDCTVAPAPPRAGPAQLTLTVTDSAGRPVEGAQLKIEGNMAHAGMTPVFTDAREEGPGRYGADLEFTMGGDWFLLIDGRLPDGGSFHKKIDVKGVKAE